MLGRRDVGATQLADHGCDGARPAAELGQPLTTAQEARGTRPPKAEVYTARLTIDVTPELRGRVKIEAFRRGITVAEMVRDLLAERFPEDGAET